MSDASVAEALRSTAHRVVIEAPAGTGKTHQAASYARHAAGHLLKGQRVLILAHTHAACDVFSARTNDLGASAHVGTIDSLVAMIAKAYHRALDLPADIHAWSIGHGAESYAELARRVRLLLDRSPAVGGALAERNPIVICDEHQDASGDQHGIVEALARAGSRLRFFGDPMQAIFASGAERQQQEQQWERLRAQANACERLDHPHRWDRGTPALGAWVLEQRRRLEAGAGVDLRAGRPTGLHLLRADNQSRRYGGFQLHTEARRPIDALVRSSPNLLVLTPQKASVLGLHAFWGWRIPIWEGHTRDALGQLLAACRRGAGDPVALGKALCAFLQAVGKGFAATSFENRLIQELETGCAKSCRGRPAEIQSVARLIADTPNHIGIGAALERIGLLIQSSAHFADSRIDLRREFFEATRMQSHADVGTFVQSLTHLRGRTHQVPARAISTIHKSKGLETRNAIVLPCDAQSLTDTNKNRCLLYVALSRSCEQLVLVAPVSEPSPLLEL